MKKTLSLSGARDALPVTRRHLLFGCAGTVAGSLVFPSLAAVPANEGHVLEAHVPALEVKRLLAAKPDATGLAASLPATPIKTGDIQ